MFTEIMQTRFSDTDALGHINNTMVPIWFEGARDPVFRLFTPDLVISEWKLILAKIDVEFHGELFYGKPVEIRSIIGRIGNASFDVCQEVWQEGEKKASGTAVMVHFNHEQKKPKALPNDIREQLVAHLQ